MALFSLLPCGLLRLSRLPLVGLEGAGAGGGGLPTPGESVYLFHWPCFESGIWLVFREDLDELRGAGGGGGSSTRPLLAACSVNTVRLPGTLGVLKKYDRLLASSLIIYGRLKCTFEYFIRTSKKEIDEKII